MFKITLQRLPATIEFEAGSISEINGILQQEDTELRKFITIADELSASNGSQEDTQEAVPDAPKESKRTRGPNKNKPAAEATAPAPMPVPDAPTTATTVLPPNELPGADAPALADDGIPEALRRVPAPPALVAPPPPPPPAAPPSGILAGKIIAELDTRKATTADNGKSLAEWLGACNVVTPGVTYDAAIAAVRMTTDDRLHGVAIGLGLAA